MQLKGIRERQREKNPRESGEKGEEEKDFRDVWALYT